MQRMSYATCQEVKSTEMKFQAPLQFRKFVTLIVLSYCFATVFFSCTKDQPLLTADIKALTERLSEDYPDCSCDPFLDEYRLNNQTVYVLVFSAPFCNWVPAYYNDKGQPITALQSSNYNDFLQGAQHIRNVWTCGQ
jgi:hypothetical protein